MVQGPYQMGRGVGTPPSPPSPSPPPPVPRPPEYPKYRFRHLKYRFRNLKYRFRHPKYKFKLVRVPVFLSSLVINLVRVPVFLSSKLSQNGSCSSISQFKTDYTDSFSNIFLIPIYSVGISK